MMTWRKKEATKRRVIINGKRNAWEKFIPNLNPRKGQKELWALGLASLWAVQPLLSNPGSRITDLKEKADLLIDSILEKRNANQSTKNEIKTSIEKALNPTNRNPLNSTITKDEVNRALTKLKSKAVGPDSIHNQMLANLSPDNRDYMRHLFNLLLHHGFAPQAWKEATIIPILKPNKQPDDPLSYRPISLTSCLSKIMK